MKRIFILTQILLMISQTFFGQISEKKQYTATRITVAPVINGILNDEAWISGSWEGSFTQNEPYSGRPESQRTEFKIVYDEDNLYVAIKAYDTNPDSIVNRLTRRDEQDGDLVGIIIDSFHDLRTGFLFGVSSAGVKYDHMMTNDGENEDPTWDPNWLVKTSVNNEGWIAEMKIPFSQVRFEKNSGDVWGFDVGRVLYRKSETTYWQHIPKEASGLIHLFAELKGLEEIKPRKIFDVTPYAVARTETFQTIPENPFLAKGKLSSLNGGIDAKIGITNNLTMDLTLNPDFGQVEADPSEVNLTAFETFFTEKRPFFIEGNNITNFNIGIGDGEVGNDNLFYSRRIGRHPQGYPDLKDGWNADVPGQSTILGATKLTGKTRNGLSVGVIEALTAQMDAEVDTLGGRMIKTVEPLTNYFVGRMQKDINNGNTLIGGIFTSANRRLDSDVSDFMHKAAYTGGLDFTQYFKNKNWMFNLNTAFSLVQGSKKAIEHTQESSARYFQSPDKKYAILDTNRTNLEGSGGRVQILKLNGHWNFMGATTWKSPGFELNDLGYLREADQIFSALWTQYNQFEPGWIYRRYNINWDVYSFLNFGGNNIAKGFEWNANMDLKNFWSIYTGGALRGSNLDQALMRGGPIMKTPGNYSTRFSLTTDNRKKLVFNTSINTTTGFQNCQRSFNASAGISFKPNNRLVVTFNPGFSKYYCELQYVTSVKVVNTDKYIFADINQKTIKASFRINLNLSPDLTLQYWGQPFFATGKYTNHKMITNPMAADYNSRFHTYSDDQISKAGNSYNIDENSDGNTDYSFDNMDFNYQAFLSNLVIRWEFNPGSSFYLVWSQTRNSSNSNDNLDLLNDLGNLFSQVDNKPHNVFLIKFSYRFGLK
jgi:hypothetical protein